MTTKLPPSLRRIMRDLAAIADVAGEAGPLSLAHGATLRMRCTEAVDPCGHAVVRRQLIIARHGAPIGLVETATFLAHGAIPSSAVGVCYPPDRHGRWRVAYTWEVRVTPFAVLPLPLPIREEESP